MSMVPATIAVASLVMGDAIECARMKAKSLHQKILLESFQGQIGCNLWLPERDIITVLDSVPCLSGEEKVREVGIAII
jgi:hypothetical protein